MFARIKSALWGDLTVQEFKRFGMLSITLMCIIGGYWLMRPLKDGLFMKIVGRPYIPYAKMLSVLIIFPLVLIYSKLVDLVEKQKLFYLICGFYGFSFLIYGILLQSPTIGLANTQQDKWRLLGWFIYLTIESFGTLTVALFWSFVSSNTDTSAAKRGYPLIISGAQVGAIAGPLLATQAESLGMIFLCGVVAAGIFAVPALVKWFITVYPSSAETSVSEKAKTGLFEGLRLLVSRPYLIGLLGVATLYEIIGTIIDYQMKALADAAYPTAAGVTGFLGLFGVATNVLALVFALVGSTFFIRRYGLRFCLIAFPVSIVFALLYVLNFPALYSFFCAAVAIKGLSYALNNPCKEIMYIPTSKDVKFKAKSWIDMFGSRSAKGLGSGINAWFPALNELMFYGPLISLGITGIWIGAAYYVGTRNKQLTDSGKIIS